MFLPRLYHRSAPGGLRTDHLGPLRSDPPQRLHLVECLPHPQQPDPAARRVNDRIRQLPPQLLRDLISHRLLAFHAKWFFQRRDVKPSLGLPALTNHPRAIADQPIDVRDLRSVAFALHAIRHRHVFRHEDMRLDPCRRAICRQCARRIPRGRNRNLLDPIRTRHCHRHPQPARLERPCRVQTLIFNEDILVFAARHQRRESFSKRHRFHIRQHIFIAPHRRRSCRHRLALHLRKLIPHPQRSTTLRASVLRTTRRDPLPAPRALKMRNLGH